MIETYEKDLEESGSLSFEMRSLPSGQSEKIHKFNEQQELNKRTATMYLRWKA